MQNFELDLSGTGDVVQGGVALEGGFKENKEVNLSRLSLGMQIEGENYEEKRNHGIEPGKVIGRPHRDIFKIHRVVEEGYVDIAHLGDMHPCVQTQRTDEPDASICEPVLLYTEDTELSDGEERELYIRSQERDSGNQPLIEGVIETGSDTTTYSFGGSVRTEDAREYADELMTDLGLPTTHELSQRDLSQRKYTKPREYGPLGKAYDWARSNAIDLAGQFK